MDIGTSEKATHVVPLTRTCGNQWGTALGSVVLHWFPHVRVNVATRVAFSDVPMSLGIPPHGYTYSYSHGQWDIRESHSDIHSVDRLSFYLLLPLLQVPSQFKYELYSGGWYT